MTIELYQTNLSSNLEKFNTYQYNEFDFDTHNKSFKRSVGAFQLV